MPITSASTSSARLELLLVVDLDEHVEVERPAPRACSAPSALRLERGDDQQDRVGARGRGLVDLVRVDDEVLAQHGQVRGRRARRAGRRASRRSGDGSVRIDSAAAPPRS